MHQLTASKAYSNAGRAFLPTCQIIADMFDSHIKWTYLDVEITEINSRNVWHSIKIPTTISGGPDKKMFLAIVENSSVVCCKEKELANFFRMKSNLQMMERHGLARRCCLQLVLQPGQARLRSFEGDLRGHE